MTETKRCCDECRGVSFGENICWRKNCPCHVPVSEPSLQEKIAKLALVEGDVCDKHKKEDCMECFYTTPPIDPTPTPPPTEWEEKLLNLQGEDLDDTQIQLPLKPLKNLILELLTEQKARMVEGLKELEIHQGQVMDGDKMRASPVVTKWQIDDIIKALSK